MSPYLVTSFYQHKGPCLFSGCIVNTFVWCETWLAKAVDLQSLSSFHHRCARYVLGITRSKQWEEHISVASVLKQARPRPVPEIVSMRRLRWLGHLAWVEDNSIPKQLLFRELLKTRPRPGMPKRWRDNVANGLKDCNLREWCGVAQKRPDWKTVVNFWGCSYIPSVSMWSCVLPLVGSNSPFSVLPILTELEQCRTMSVLSGDLLSSLARHYCTILYCVVLYCVVLCCVVLCCVVLCCVVLCCVVLCCVVLCCVVLCCVVLCCIVLYCIVLCLWSCTPVMPFF